VKEQADDKVLGAVVWRLRWDPCDILVACRVGGVSVWDAGSGGQHACCKRCDVDFMEVPTPTLPNWLYVPEKPRT